MVGAALLRIAAGCAAVAALAGLPGLADGPWAARVLGQARERVIYVTVFDPATNKPLETLTPDSFVIREDGVQREILRVTRASSPLTVAIVVDNSHAVSPAINDLRKALTSFLTAIDGIGPVAIVTVADRPTVFADYTTSQKALLDAAGRLFALPSSGATLIDGISEVAKGLAKREGDRAAIVVVATENTEFSHPHDQDVLEALRNSGAAAHAVVLLNQRASYTTNEEKSRATVLDRGPRESGGIRMDILTSMSFEARLKDLASFLKAQHRVVYARPQQLIPPERIEVRATRPGLEARGTVARGQGE